MEVSENFGQCCHLVLGEVSRTLLVTILGKASKAPTVCCSATMQWGEDGGMLLGKDKTKLLHLRNGDIHRRVSQTVVDSKRYILSRDKVKTPEPDFQGSNPGLTSHLLAILGQVTLSLCASALSAIK